MFIRVIIFFMISALSICASNSVIEIGGYNVRTSGDGNYLVDIYASNRQTIAGIQFELLEQDFEILDYNPHPHIKGAVSIWFLVWLLKSIFNH